MSDLSLTVILHNADQAAMARIGVERYEALENDNTPTSGRAKN